MAILSATGRDLFDATEVAHLLDLVEAAAIAAEAVPGSDVARADLSRRAGEARTQLSGMSYISATRAQDIALDCWGPLETLTGPLN